MNEVVPLSKDFDKLKAQLTNPSKGQPSDQPEGKHHDRDRDRDHDGREDDSLIKPLVNQEVKVLLRNGQSFTGTLRKVARFELYVETTEAERLIVPKHSIDLIEVREETAR